jgi:hypothetical protein
VTGFTCFRPIEPLAHAAHRHVIGRTLKGNLMKQVVCRTAIVAALLMSTSAFAGAVAARPVTEFDLMGAGLGPVDIITPANVTTRTDRRVQSLAVTVRDGQGNALAGVTCTLANDQGSWSVQAGESVTIRRSSSDLRTTCMKDGQVIASAAVPSAKVHVQVASGPFAGEVVATIPAYPFALVFAPASTAAGTAPSPLAQH